MWSKDFVCCLVLIFCLFTFVLNANKAVKLGELGVSELKLRTDVINNIKHKLK